MVQNGRRTRKYKNILYPRHLRHPRHPRQRPRSWLQLKMWSGVWTFSEALPRISHSTAGGGIADLLIICAQIAYYKLHITHCILHLAPCTLHIAHITHCILHTLPICWSLVHPLGPTLPSRCSRPHLDHLLSFKPSSIHPTQSSQVQMNGKSRLRKYCSKWDRPYWWWAIIAKIFANQVSGGCRRNCLHLSDKIPLGFPPFFLCRI